MTANKIYSIVYHVILTDTPLLKDL